MEHYPFLATSTELSSVLPYVHTDECVGTFGLVLSKYKINHIWIFLVTFSTISITFKEKFYIQFRRSILYLNCQNGSLFYDDLLLLNIHFIAFILLTLQTCSMLFLGKAMLLCVPMFYISIFSTECKKHF